MLPLVVAVAENEAVLDPDETPVQAPSCLPEHGPERLTLRVCVENVRAGTGAAGIEGPAVCLKQELPELALRHVVVLDLLAVRALIIHVIGRVSEQQIGQLAVHQPLHVLRAGAVTAHDPVVAQQPDVAALGDGLLRGLCGEVVLFDLLVDLDLEVQAEVGHVVFDAGQLLHQKLQVPLGNFAGGVVCDAQGLDLFRVELCRNDDRHFLQLEPPGGLVPGVSGDDHAVPVHDDGGLESELFDAVGHGFCGLVVAPGVIVIGADFVQPFVLDLVLHALHAIPPGNKIGSLAIVPESLG